ncbi:MAG TPA: hypothetical protein VLL52_13130 [Anaerolineae bacterium]|nr:hypothetical protein [Anaerolineae bacterium]
MSDKINQLKALEKETNPSTTCPECQSTEIYRYKKLIDSAGGAGPILLPKLNPNFLSEAKMIPVVCADCGYIRFYASLEATEKLRTSDHWEKID